MKRAAGIFLHPTSLPSRFGIGDFGESARRWVDLLSAHHQQLWQVCPLGPTGYGDSPYQSLCSSAGNTLLIAPMLLSDLLTDNELAEFPHLPDDSVDYGRVIVEKERLFLKAYDRFRDTPEFTAFCEREREWLDDFALFAVIKARHGGRAWVEWDPPLKLRNPDALKKIQDADRRAIRFHKFLQFVFFRQWTDLHDYAKTKNVRIIGDMPYYVAGDSSDTWSSPHLFELDDKGNQLRLAGVPPDYFSESGQLWGNPIYRWDVMRRDDYAWWVRRVGKALELVDYLRLDHFRGFDSYWAIPGGSADAVNGTWEDGPGIELFSAIRRKLGEAALIAEDLGDITPRVEELRRLTGLPGMKVLQFAFDGDPGNIYLPSNVNADSIMYTGTHDNDTSRGWFTSLNRHDRSYVCRYLGCTEHGFIERFLRLAYMSPSRFCIIPLQDILGLPGKDRMNVPGSESGNWRWRAEEKWLDKKHFGLIADLTEVYGRVDRAADVPQPSKTGA
jgi:4-alpha-glucanotransferase